MAWLVGWLVGCLAAFAQSATEVKGECTKQGHSIVHAGDLSKNPW